MNITFEEMLLQHEGFELTANFQMASGKIYALIGPSGGGKSTLLSALAGFHTASAGRLIIDDQDMTKVAPGNRPVSLLFQDHNLFPHLTAVQNVGLALKTSLRLSAVERQVVKDALGRVGLGDQTEKYPSELSGGQQQRVAIARAILRDRPILLLDEPFAALGPALKHEMLALVSEIAEATSATVIMVTHQPEDALVIADETILIAGGVVHNPIPTAQLFENPPPALQSYLGTPK